jgi:molecular chaperone DnaK
MTRDLLDRTSFTTRQTLQAAGLEWPDINRVLLVGGSSRMPAVVEILRRISGKEPDCSVSPDEAVAHGAALHAGLLLSIYEGKSPSFRIRNVNSHSLGVVATDARTKRPRNAILIPRNTPLPTVARRIFKTHKASQRSILVKIVEGESLSPDDCSQLGKCSVRNLPEGLPAQTPIDVRFRYEENGRLTVNVRVEGTTKELLHEITRENSLTPEQLDSWRNHICKLEPARTSQSIAPQPALAQPAAAAPTAQPAAKPVKPVAAAKDLATLAAEVLEADDEDDAAQSGADSRGDFIRTRYAEEQARLRGTSNDAQRSDELAFQFILKEFSLRRPDLELILKSRWS